MKSKWLRNLTIALLLLSLSSSAWVFVFKKNCSSSEVLNALTSEERYYLDAFLCRILFRDDFAYVLFGSKPVAFTSYSKSNEFNIKFESESESNFKIRKGLDVFKKNKQFFLSRNIIVHLHEHCDYSVILIINKKNLLSVFSKYKSDFNKILGFEITSDDFLSQIVESDDFGDVIKNHEALLGMLLGYGRDNSWLFYNKKKILRELNEFNSPLKRRDMLEKEYAEIDQQMEPFSDSLHQKSFLKNPLVSLPHFMANPNSSETKELKEKYGKDREKIMKIFAKQNVLDVTVKWLTDNY